jgi:hypothetical protein
MLLGSLNSEDIMEHVASIGIWFSYMHTNFWPEGIKKIKHLGELCTERRMIFKWVLNKKDKKIQTGFNWHRTESTDKLS